MIAVENAVNLLEADSISHSEGFFPHRVAGYHCLYDIFSFLFVQDVNSPDVYETSDLPEDEQLSKPPVSMIKLMLTELPMILFI